MTQQSTPRVFAFQTEFTPAGDVIGGANRKFYTRDEVEQMSASARTEGEKQAQARGYASIDRMAGHLAPVAPQLAALAETLRREAAELAMIAAARIAGHALDANGSKVAAEAIASAVRLLKNAPNIIVSAAADAAPEIQPRLEALRKEGRVNAIAFSPDASAKPGDWRVEWAEGSVGFSRDDVEAAVNAIIEARLNDPVAPQLELFSVA
jgi:flagellar biosynthesis/type III secretory pathway protein FliH